jgi:hypothetical protein
MAVSKVNMPPRPRRYNVCRLYLSISQHARKQPQKPSAVWPTLYAVGMFAGEVCLVVKLGAEAHEGNNAEGLYVHMILD